MEFWPDVGFSRSVRYDPWRFEPFSDVRAEGGVFSDVPAWLKIWPKIRRGAKPQGV